jgi:hypothetical protein
MVSCNLTDSLGVNPTNRKIAGSVIDSVIEIFHLHKASGRTMILGSTKPLTEMSTRDVSLGIKTAGT